MYKDPADDDSAFMLTDEDLLVSKPVDPPAEVPPSPCELGCAFEKQCELRKLACYDFFAYTRGSSRTKVRDPNRKMYNRIYQCA